MDKLFILNTLTKEKEEFVPIDAHNVRMYHCGPTVYWVQHIGNLRAVVMADIIKRTLMYAGFEVSLVRNYTDVGHLTGDNIGDADSGEDRMEKASARESLTPDQIANKYIAIFNSDRELLGTLAPENTPRATSYIQHMIDMVQILLEQGYAYSTPLAIYFDISKAYDYTRLSGQKIDALLSGTGHGTVSDTNKKNPGDFALWFFKAGSHAQALQTWESPFASTLVEKGRGFPGWHIECSAMSKALLGNTLDIHMGGIEHIPVHHTNEIAQSESANGAPYVHYWIHNEHLLIDGKKMSKSEGTAYTLSDIVSKGYNPLALRMFFLQAHYRSKQNFTWEALDASAQALKKLIDFVSRTQSGGTILLEEVAHIKEALYDDFNTSLALGRTFELLRSSNYSDADKRATLLDIDKVFGLSLEKQALAQSAQKEEALPEEIAKLVQERDSARANKNYAESDRLRTELEKHGFSVIDTKEGTQVSKNL